MQAVIAVDPGRDKTGIAVVSNDGEALHIVTVLTDELKTQLEKIWKTYVDQVDIEKIVCGNGTTHQSALLVLEKVAKVWETEVALVEESFSTREGRRLYFKENPPKGIKKWIPLSFLDPPRPVDDYTAWIIGKRYWSNNNNNSVGK